MLSVIIPTFNEEKRITRTLEKLSSFLSKRFDYEIIVVDDGVDSTAAIARSFAKKNKNPRVRVIRLPRNEGKGGAVKKGLLAARGSEIVVYDADAAVPTSEIPKLVRALKTFDVAIGSRKNNVGPLYRRLIRAGYNAFVRLLFAWRFRDTQCGFKALRKTAAKKIAGLMRRNGFEFDVELLALARKHGFSVVEVPVEWRHVPGGPIEAASPAKKLCDAARMLCGTIKIRFEV